MSYERYCENCEQAYEAKREHSKYCCDKCRGEAFQNNKNKELFLKFVQIFRGVGMTDRGMIKLINEDAKDD